MSAISVLVLVIIAYNTGAFPVTKSDHQQVEVVKCNSSKKLADSSMMVDSSDLIVVDHCVYPPRNSRGARDRDFCEVKIEVDPKKEYYCSSSNFSDTNHICQREEDGNHFVCKCEYKEKYTYLYENCTLHECKKSLVFL